MRKLLLIVVIGVAAPAAFATSSALANTATPSCNGGSCTPWFNIDVPLSWTFDPTPPTATDAGCDNQTITTEGDNSVTCTVTWDPDSLPFTAHVKIDKTAPTVTGASASGSTANGAGWFRTPVSWVFDGTDTLSDIDTCQTVGPYSGPDSVSASVSGTCMDNAGNTSAATPHGFKYDGTPPTGIGGTPTRVPDHGSWFNHAVTLNMTGSDATSGIDSCTHPTYSGPDSGSATASGSCTDTAGNSQTGNSSAFKYDATAPTVNLAASRGPDHDNWYTAPVTISWGGADATSGLDAASCTSNDVFSTETPAQVVTGSCSDNAGNTGSASVTVHYDSVPPTVNVTASRAPDSGVWFNHPVTFTWGGTDATSGVDTASCTSPVVDFSINTASQVLSGSCADKAGHVTPAQMTVHYDSVSPTNNGGAPGRPPDHNGWYNHPVSIPFTGGATGVSGLAGCDKLTYSGPDGAGVSTTGNCRSNAGLSAPAQSSTFDYDATAPSVTVTPDRPPDHNGWYTHPVTFAVHGTDTASGVTSCGGGGTYAGPDTGFAGIVGGCNDLAGNPGFGSAGLRYDATAPAAPTLRALPGKNRVKVSWTVPRDATSVVVTRSQAGAATPQVVYSGSHASFTDKKLKRGIKYRYTVTDADAAGNSASQSIVAVPTKSSLRPFAETSVTGPPKLKWKKRKGARYYNVQLWRDGAKVLSTWPRKPFLQIKPSWSFGGNRYTFVPGHYRWYVWPGFGLRSKHRYGHLIGKSTFSFAVPL